MSRLQVLLVLVLTTLTVIVFSPLAWGVLAPVASAVLVATTSLVRSIPEWGWWAAFGIAMSMRCRFSRARFSGCGRRSASVPST